LENNGLKVNNMLLSLNIAIENQSIIRRLTAALIFTVLIVSVIAVSAVYLIESQSAIQGLERKADETLAYLIGTLEVPLWAVDNEGVRSIGRAVSQDESIERLSIRNESGENIFFMEKGKESDLINRSGRIFHKQWGLEKPAGDVSVSLTAAKYNESNRQLLFFSILIIFLILTAVVIVTIIFIRTSLNKPLKSLNEITEDFASGKYVTSGHVLPYLEFQPFGKALVDMAEKIEGQIGKVRKAEEAVRKLNAELEQRVAERTAELIAAKEQAEDANRVKSVFLSTMSHELRTPLTAILGYTQILKRQNNLFDRQRQQLEIIHTSGEHLLSLIDDILDMGKIEAQKMELEELMFDLPSLLGQVFNIARIKAEEKDLSLVYETSDGLPEYVRGDDCKLKQILLNLLSNAVKYTRRGKVTLRVSYDYGDTGLFRCEVADTGIGIASDKLQTIFEPFTQLAAEGQVREGSGLGLAITKRLVTLMLGRIGTESELGRGSTFWVEVPLPTASAGEIAVETARVTVTGYRGERKSILLAEDNITNASMLVSMLEPLGFEIITAGNGQVAVNLAIEQRPDLVLLDLLMPVMDGFEAVKEMRRRRELDETRIIGISASATKSMLRDEFIAACDDFAAKPIQLDTLLEKIGSQLRIVWETALPLEPVAVLASERETFALPPLQQMNELHELAMRGDMREIQAWASALEKRDNRFSRFADKLRELAKGYKANAILALIEHHLGKTNEY
jgi:signal transduction histidine kinase/DNA-binding response OmpR family regulator